MIKKLQCIKGIGVEYGGLTSYIPPEISLGVLNPLEILQNPVRGKGQFALKSKTLTVCVLMDALIIRKIKLRDSINDVSCISTHIQDGEQLIVDVKF